MMKYLRIGVAVLVVLLLSICYIQRKQIAKIRAESERNRNNVEVLMSDVQKYKTSDSLNAASVESLHLTLKQFEKWRSEDLATIKTLRSKNDNLASVVKNQTDQIYLLSSAVKDTVVIRDSVPVPAQSVRCGVEWYSFEGLLSEGTFSGTMETRDDILVAEFIKYKRFLGFLWKTKKVKERKIEVVSRNPHSKITDIEFVKFTNNEY